MRARQLLDAARRASGKRREWLTQSASVALDSLHRMRPRDDAADLVPTDPTEAQLRGEQAFQAGLRHERYAAWPLAAREHARACACVPEAGEYRLHLLWARLKAGEGDPSACREELEQLSMAVLRQDNESAFAHYVRGQLALLRGDHEKAMRAFKVALRLDPSHVDTARHLRILARRLE
jgi:tetratricopeptide (TPR) repeat protein